MRDLTFETAASEVGRKSGLNHNMFMRGGDETLTFRLCVISCDMLFTG